MIILNKSDYEDINSLLRIGESLLETYEQLALLEASNLKESSDYKRYIEKLKSSLQVEENILSRLTIDYDKIDIIIYYLIQQLEVNPNVTTLVDIIIKNLTKSLLINRIVKKLSIYQIKNPKEYIKSQLTKEEVKKIPKETINEMEGESKLGQALQNDQSILLTYLLERKINNLLSKNIREELIRSKYLLSYMVPAIEEQFLSNNFNIPDEIYFTSDFVSKFYKIPGSIAAYLRKSIAIGNYEQEVEKFLEMNNEMFASLPLEVALRELIIRTSLQFLTDEEITELNEKLHNLIDEEQYIINFEESIDALTRAFKSFNKDKALIRKVTLAK